MGGRVIGVPPKSCVFFFGTASKQEAAVLKAVEEVHRTVEDAPVIV